MEDSHTQLTNDGNQKATNEYIYLIENMSELFGVY